MLSIHFQQTCLDFFLDDSNFHISIADLKKEYNSVGSYLLNIINVESIKKVEMNINCLELLQYSIDLDLTIFTSCNELVINSKEAKTNINFCMLPENIEKLIIKYNLSREKAIVNLDNLPINLKYFVVTGVIVNNFCYLPVGLVDLNMYECYQNCGDTIYLPLSLSNFKCTYISRNFKVERKLEKALYGDKCLDVNKNYLDGGIIKTFF